MNGLSEEARELIDCLEEQFGVTMEELRAMLPDMVVGESVVEALRDAEHAYRRELLREETRSPMGARMGRGTVHIIEYERFSRMRHNPLKVGFLRMGAYHGFYRAEKSRVEVKKHVPVF